MRKILAATVALAALAAAVAWGILIHRNHIFPFRTLRSAYRFAEPLHRAPRRWHLARPNPAGAPASPERIHELANLPYLQGYRPATVSGVLVHDRGRVEDGLNFFTSGHAPVATLMDMDGRVIKTWKADAHRAFPGLALTGVARECASFFRCGKLLPDGGVLAIFDQLGLVRLDSESRLLWVYRATTHHDLYVEPDGQIAVLERERHDVPSVERDEPVWEDFVTQLTADGHFIRRISLLKALQQSNYAPLLTHRLPSEPDLFHTNSVQVFDGSLAGRWPLLRRGNILVSLHNLDTLAILDPQEGRIVWALTGQWRAQHSAEILSTGRLLLFDNFGTMREASRVLEVDPFTQQVVWSYGGVAGQDLFSETAGYQQRLGNGNTLVSESNFGRALEITPDHRVVWEFVNPNRAGEKHELVAALYTMDRVRNDLPFLGAPSVSSDSAVPAPATKRP